MAAWVVVGWALTSAVGRRAVGNGIRGGGSAERRATATGEGGGSGGGGGWLGGPGKRGRATVAATGPP